MTGPAISFEKVQEKAPGLLNLAKTAAHSLEKKGLTGHRAAVYLVLDHSGSMRNHYAEGNVQRLTDQALGLSVNVDDDGTVPLSYFTDDVYGLFNVSLTDYQGVVDITHPHTPWGYTNYAAAIDAAVRTHLDTAPNVPGLVIFQTDGDPYTREDGSSGAKKKAVEALKAASHHPLFFSFVGFGQELGFLRKLDDLRVGFGGRKVDNASLFETGYDPKSVTDAELYDGIMHEYPQWLAAARSTGILP